MEDISVKAAYEARKNVIEIKAPYLIFVGDEEQERYAKTALGLVHWRKEDCVGQIALRGGKVDLGLPTMSIREAKEAGAASLIIGTAAMGGGLQKSWRPVLIEALKQGFDIVGGLHDRLNDDSELKAIAEQAKSRLIDVRVPPADLPVGSGVPRSGMRLLTVGTDCAVGKKYTALSLWQAFKERGGDADFRASGQTGIMIAGGGIPIDSVVGDFISGAAELLSPPATADHWDFIEGQGSLYHAGYAAVSLGLLHGSQPDAIVVCHDVGREWVGTSTCIRIPDITDCIERNLVAARLTNPNVVCAGVSVNTSSLGKSERKKYLTEIAQQTGVPCVDPLITGVDPILDRLATISTQKGVA